MIAQLGHGENTMAEFKPTTPRLKAAPMQSNPEIGIGIGEKGGISLYVRGQRFPVTLYFEQWELVLAEPVVAEIKAFALEHADLLADKPEYGKKEKAEPVRMIGITDAEMKLVDAEIARLTDAADVPGAVKYATIKNAAERNGGKLAVEDMIDVYALKAKKG
jgi:hypothetical protein